MAHLSGRFFDLLESSIGDQVIIAILNTVDLIAVDQSEPRVIKLVRLEGHVQQAVFERRIALRTQTAIIQKRNLLVCRRKVSVIKCFHCHSILWSSFPSGLSYEEKSRTGLYPAWGLHTRMP